MTPWKFNHGQPLHPGVSVRHLSSNLNTKKIVNGKICLRQNKLYPYQRDQAYLGVLVDDLCTRGRRNYNNRCYLELNSRLTEKILSIDITFIFIISKILILSASVISDTSINVWGGVVNDFVIGSYFLLLYGSTNRTNMNYFERRLYCSNFLALLDKWQIMWFQLELTFLEMSSNILATIFLIGGLGVLGTNVCYAILVSLIY